MIRIPALLSTFLFSVALWSCASQTEPDPVPGGTTPGWQTVRMYSVQVQDTVVIDISIPDSYNLPKSQVRYPVLYLTDGYWRRDQHKPIHAMAYTEPVREMIIVGIGYPDTYDPNTIRVRDLVTSPGKFLDFILQKLIPSIDQRYRTTGERTLAGASYGGFFGMYALFMYVDKTHGVFQNYIVASPTVLTTTQFEGKTTNLLGFESRMSYQTAEVNASLYIVVGGLEDPNWYLTPISDLVSMLQSRNYVGFSMKSYVDPGKDHSTVWEPALYAGVRMFFKRSEW